MRVKLTLDEQQATDMYVALRVAAWAADRPIADPVEAAENIRCRGSILKLADLVMDAKVTAARSPYRPQPKSAAERKLAKTPRGLR